MSEQSPFDLFSSSSKKSGKKMNIGKGEKIESPKAAPKGILGREHFQVEEALLAMKEKQKILENSVKITWKQRDYPPQFLSTEKIDIDQLPSDVKQKIEALAGQIAQAAGEKVLPQKYRRPTSKPISEKERKGKTLGSKKKWMPMQ